MPVSLMNCEPTNKNSRLARFYLNTESLTEDNSPDQPTISHTLQARYNMSASLQSHIPYKQYRIIIYLCKQQQLTFHHVMGQQLLQPIHVRASVNGCWSEMTETVCH
ncbi:hypothetical protein CBL_12221 [Carabus blaptoides fortunei]